MRSAQIITCAVSSALAWAASGCTITTGYPAAGTPGSYGAGLEPNVDRPGSDYRNFDLPYPRAEDCRDACLSDPGCAAFTYVNPGVQGPSARCWLKNSVPASRYSDCCVSGSGTGGGRRTRAAAAAVEQPTTRSARRRRSMGNEH